MRFLTIPLVTALTIAAPATAQDAPKEAQPGGKSPVAVYDEKVAKAVGDAWVMPPATEQESVTAHSVVVDGRTLKYHATAGTVTIKDDSAKPTASVFYVAYTLDGAAPGTRPVTFF